MVLTISQLRMLTKEQKRRRGVIIKQLQTKTGMTRARAIREADTAIGQAMSKRRVR